MIKLVEILEKHNSLITITDGNYFSFCNISSKVCNNACIMPRFGKNHFRPFLLSVFKVSARVREEAKDAGC